MVPELLNVLLTKRPLPLIVPLLIVNVPMVFVIPLAILNVALLLMFTVELLLPSALLLEETNVPPLSTIDPPKLLEPARASDPVVFV